jgi:hypothetical protein
MDTLKILKSGDFTILYHDNGQCDLFEGKYDSYEDVPEGVEPIQEFYSNDSEGYCPDIVSLLTKALGGKTYSI